MQQMMMDTQPPTQIETAERLLQEHRFGEAERTLAPLLAADPFDPHALYVMTGVLLAQARTEEAVRLSQRLAALDANPQSHSDMLFYGLHLWPQSFAHMHRQWHDRFAPRGTARPSSDWDGQRPIRVGYLSCNLREHTVTKFLEPVLEHHSDAVETYLYVDNQHDAVTARLVSHVDHWRDVSAYDDKELYRGLRHDRLDVLVDLTGHLSSGRRQPVVAAWPAPVICNYIGYPHWTGQDGVCRITDHVADPDVGDEKIVRLDGCAWAYRPDDKAPDVRPLGDGPVVFGSLNRVCKIRPAMIRMWHTILARVPDSTLLVLCPGGESNTAIRTMFDPARVRLVPTGDRRHYLDVINRIDVALDTFPYGGMTTTCDCLWQGVPVVTLADAAHVSRVGASLLTRVGLPDLVATTPGGYVEVATALAGDRPRLAGWRASCRSVMQATLCDGARVARDLERAYAQLVNKGNTSCGSDASANPSAA